MMLSEYCFVFSVGWLGGCFCRGAGTAMSLTVHPGVYILNIKTPNTKSLTPTNQWFNHTLSPFPCQAQTGADHPRFLLACGATAFSASVPSNKARPNRTHPRRKRRGIRPALIQAPRRFSSRINSRRRRQEDHQRGMRLNCRRFLLGFLFDDKVNDAGRVGNLAGPFGWNSLRFARRRRSCWSRYRRRCRF